MSPQELDWDHRHAMGNFAAQAASTMALQQPLTHGLIRTERSPEMEKRPLRSENDSPLRGVRSNIVQSIRAFHIPDLQRAAVTLGQHFLYANMAHAQNKADVLELISAQFHFPPHFGKNFDALYDCLTDPLHKAGPQPGFVVVLDQIPITPKFDKEAREQFLDCFRDAADYWGERKISFRCFYSFL